MEKKSWSAFFLAVFIILAIPVFVLFLFSHAVTGDYLPIIDKGWGAFSRKSEEWSNFGSLLSGLFGLSSALATMITLGFVIYQSNESIRRSDKQAEIIANSQKEQNKKIEEHNEKVNDFYKQSLEFNKFQEGRMVFEKYKLHIDMFDALISSIEKDLGHLYLNCNIKITLPSELYSAIFPLNNFVFFDNNPQQNSSLRSMQKDLADIYAWVNKNDWEEDSIQQILLPFIKIRDALHINITPYTNSSGDIFTRKHNQYTFNIHCFFDEVQLLFSLVNRVLHFANFEKFSNEYFANDKYITEARLIELSNKLQLQKGDQNNFFYAFPSAYTETQAGFFILYSKMLIIEKNYDVSFVSFLKPRIREIIMQFHNNKNFEFQGKKDFLVELSAELERIGSKHANKHNSSGAPLEIQLYNMKDIITSIINT